MPHMLRHGHLITLYAILVTLFLSAGCAGTRKVAEPRPGLPARFPNHSIAEVRQNIAFTTDTLASFSGRASFVVDTPDQSGRFSATVRAHKSDSVFLSISPGLGIEAARALVTPDSFFLYDRIRNELMYGSVDAAGGSLGVPVGNEDLFRNLLGIIFPEPDVQWSLTSSDSLYYARDPSGQHIYTIDPAYWRVVRYEERTPSGELIEERAFSEFTLFDGTYLPRRITFRRPLDHSSASLYYRELDLNPGSLSFDLRVSESADRIPISY